MTSETRMRKVARALSAAALIATVSGCDIAAQKAFSSHAVDVFHQELDAENYTAIWNGTSGEMRAATPEPALTKLLTAIHRKLGKVVKSQFQGVNINYNTGGTFTTVTMQTQFEHGTGQEQFVFKTAGSAEQLAGYHINSNDMMTL